jgi:N-acetylneuraminic acid mutarotase
MLNQSYIIESMCINRFKVFILGFILSILFLFSHPQSVFADPIGAWSSTTNLPISIASHVSTSEGDRVFTFGGANIDDFSESYFSSKNPDGSLSTWNLASNLPETRYWGALAKKADRVFVLGGAMWTGMTNYKNTVYSATIQMDGSISSWQSLVPLPENRALGQAVVVGDRIYYAGGRLSDSVVKSEVYSAVIKEDGTLESWLVAGSLPEPLHGFGMVEHNNHLIVFGGHNGSVFSNKTYKASVNPDGSISAFVETMALPEAVFRSMYVKVGSTIISAGGLNATGFLSKVYYANINSDGTIDSWQQSANNLPVPNHAGAAAYSNGYMYVSGGFNGEYLNSVYYAPLNVSDEIITFDSLITDINSLYSLGEINFPNRTSLLAQAKTAKKLSENNITKRASIKILRAMDRQILRAKGRGVSESAYSILHKNIQALIEGLK